MRLYAKLASLIEARANCKRSGNSEWFTKHTDRILAIVRHCLPSGSGYDNATTIDLDRSTEEKIVLDTAFHHMDEFGSYDGWTHHSVTVRPSLAHGFYLTISGRNRNEIKEYIAETFHSVLSAEYPETDASEGKEA